MPRSITAHPTPAVLQWAREQQGYSLEAAADKLGRAPEVLAAWEAGTANPTVSQLRTAARVYKRALAVFFLPEPPRDFAPMPDFRTLPEGAERGYSPELLWIARAAADRQTWIRELHENEGIPPLTYVGSCAGTRDRQSIVNAIRTNIALPSRNEIRAKQTADSVLALWIAAVEDVGIFVFQSGEIAPSEARGFALVDPYSPFIFLNSKDPRSARIFTLIHEVAHILINEPGISNLEIRGIQPDGTASIEQLCNSVAAEILAPEQHIRSEFSVEADFDKLRQDIRRVANKYRVGKEVIARRLLEFGRINTPAFQNLREEYLEEWRERKEREARKPVALPFSLRVVQTRGRRFTREVFGEYSNGNLTTRDVSALLNVKAKHFSNLIERVST